MYIKIGDDGGKKRKVFYNRLLCSFSSFLFFFFSSKGSVCGFSKITPMQIRTFPSYNRSINNRSKTVRNV